jgi:hypothetical protein
MPFQSIVHDVAELQQHVENSCEAITVKVRIFKHVQQSVRHHAKPCVEMSGQYIEHLLI